MIDVDDLTHQYQTYRDAEGDIVGDCYRTALACLLEIDKEEVPHFVQLHKEDKGMEWWHHSVRFVQNRLLGWTLICVRPIYPVYSVPEESPDRVILTGDSPRGPWGHSVLASARDGSLLWDPFEGGTGVGFPWDVIALMKQPKNTVTTTWSTSKGLTIYD